MINAITNLFIGDGMGTILAKIAVTILLLFIGIKCYGVGPILGPELTVFFSLVALTHWNSWPRPVKRNRGVTIYVQEH